ncbi:DoxX family protein [Nocardioides seonyuensis]|uniref:DoxX family protein n=1 Tax=Nocardioides seonyuensis TaxID=2518371 RepID=UPI001ABEC4DA|nr:DoxX family protein [Nocardioides seonyuensis]
MPRRASPTRGTRSASTILGALGLILPAATGTAPVLAVLAAIGLAITMLLAAVVHFRRGEKQKIVPNVVLLALAATVAVGAQAL